MTLFLVRISLVLSCALTLVSCQSRAGSLINAPLNMGGRLLQAVGRTVGFAEAASPAVPTSEPEAVNERAKQIKQQGPFGEPMSMRPDEQVAKR